METTRFFGLAVKLSKSTALRGYRKLGVRSSYPAESEVFRGCAIFDTAKMAGGSLRDDSSQVMRNHRFL